jgi:hypothetical protein
MSASSLYFSLFFSIVELTIKLSLSHFPLSLSFLLSPSLSLSFFVVRVLERAQNEDQGTRTLLQMPPKELSSTFKAGGTD